MKSVRYGLPSKNEQIAESGREQCAKIERQRQAVFDQIAALLGQHGSRDDNDQRLKDLIDGWAQAEVDDAGLEAKTLLEKLLKQHQISARSSWMLLPKIYPATDFGLRVIWH